MNPDLSNDIAQQAIEPITTTTDGQSTTGRSVDELIRADQHLAQKAAAAKAHHGITHVQLLPAGAAATGHTFGPFNQG